MKISKQHVQTVLEARSGADLLPVVQKAIELEHATIPPYLCGLFTLKQSSNETVSKIIRSVVIEEMLHLTITANLVNALGGSPILNSPDFVPHYPGELPMGIGEHFKVHLRKCSIDQVDKVFMKIEEPEKPIPIRTLKAFSRKTKDMPEFDTIGAFYNALSIKIQELGEDIFVGDHSRQVVADKWFTNPDEMFPIVDVKSAVRGINLIVDQGEGSKNDPFDDTGDVSHYYRFQQIVKGKALIHKPDETPPFAFAGEAIVLDPSDVWNMDDDPKISKYLDGSKSHRLATQFSYSYTKLLNSLHSTFNGNPNEIDEAMGVMYELRLLAHQVLSTQAEWADKSETAVKQTGLSFEYVPINK